MRRVALLVAAASALTPQGMGTIEGHVTGLDNPSDVVVYLEGDADPIALESDVVTIVDQIDRKFVPFVTVIPVGAQVVFHNSEDEVHNVHAKMGKKTLFNIGMPPLGQPVPRRFREVGNVRLECDRHLTMDAWIKVLPHRYFTRPDPEGRFHLEKIPSGDHVVVAWHPYADDVPRARVFVPAERSAQASLHLEIQD